MTGKTNKPARGYHATDAGDLKIANEIANAIALGHTPPGLPARRGVTSVRRFLQDKFGYAATGADSVLQRLRRKGMDSVWKKAADEWHANRAAEVEKAAVRKPETVEERTELQRLKDEVTKLRRELTAAYRASSDADAILHHIGVMAQAPANPPDWVIKPRSKRAKPTPEVPVMLWGDWHFDEVVSAAETNGINEFNSEIAERRVRALVENTIDLCLNHHTGNYPGVVINLLGDFISGALHPELARTDEVPQIPSALRVRDLLVTALSQMADTFGKVFVPCVAGNHGRNTVKPQFKNIVHLNFDWLIYQLLHRHFENDKRITFQIPDANECFYSVFGWRFMLTHGDMLGVKGGDGIIGSIGPIMRGEKKVSGQASAIGQDFDILLMGHWHQEFWLPRAIVTNSLKGFDEYAKNALRAIPSDPSQSLFFIHPRRGITSRWSVLVEESKRAEGAPWVAVPFGDAGPAGAMEGVAA